MIGGDTIITPKNIKERRRDTMNKSQILQKLEKSLIVSVQTSEQNPLFSTEHMILLAECSAIAGCNSFRVDSPDHINAIKKAIPEALIIGIWKVQYPDSDVIITPTMKEVEALVACGVDILATDGTHRLNPEGELPYELIKRIKKRYPELVIMADIATFEEAMASQKAGADIISTTLRGYTEDTKQYLSDDCDMSFIKKLHQNIDCFLIAEGKLWTREDAIKALQSGANAVVIGTAINNPKCITERYLQAIKSTAFD